MKTISLARSAVLRFPRNPWSDRKTTNANRRAWIRARLRMKHTLLDGAAFERAPRVLTGGAILNTYERHKDAAVLAVSAAGSLPILAHDIVTRIVA